MIGVQSLWMQRRMTANGYRVAYWGDKNVLNLDLGDGYTACESTNKPVNSNLEMGEFGGVSNVSQYFF